MASELREGQMSTVVTEIAALEERLRIAELGPDPQFFEEVLDLPRLGLRDLDP